MLRGNSINPQLNLLFSQTGHTDLITVVDSGFPIPADVNRIDLAWKPNEPKWLDVCQLVKDEIAIEKIYLASEMKIQNTTEMNLFLEIFKGIDIEFISHEALKMMSRESRAVIRTGEYTPFCNCIFKAGVVF